MTQPADHQLPTIKAEDIETQIAKRSGVLPTDVTVGAAFKDLHGLEWKLGDAPPVTGQKDAYKLYALFRELDERHFYAVPIKANPDGTGLPFSRFVISKLGLDIEFFPSFELFVAEIAAARRRQNEATAPLVDLKTTEIDCAACGSPHELCPKCGQPAGTSDSVADCEGFELPAPPEP